MRSAWFLLGLMVGIMAGILIMAPRLEKSETALFEERAAHDLTRKESRYDLQECRKEVVACKFFRELAPGLAPN